MKLDRGWMWRLLLLSFLAVSITAAQEADVSDGDEDMGLDEEELQLLEAEEKEQEEEATVMDEEQLDETDGKDAGRAVKDENVSFQVRNQSQFTEMSLEQQQKKKTAHQTYYKFIPQGNLQDSCSHWRRLLGGDV